METFFTSDTHFYHENIIKYCARPFKDAVEMNEAIIANWNSVIKPNDLVYHLGDFMLGGRANKQQSNILFGELFRRLNGHIILLKGNHDSVAWANRHRFYAAHDSYHEIEVNEQKITLCHYKMAIWNRSHRGAWHLYGHSHGTATNSPHDLSFDCGVDCHNFFPLSFGQVKEIMSKKIYKSIDHHGAIIEGGGMGLGKEDYAKIERQRTYEQLKQEFDPK